MIGPYTRHNEVMLVRGSLRLVPSTRVRFTPGTGLASTLHFLRKNGTVLASSCQVTEHVYIKEDSPIEGTSWPPLSVLFVANGLLAVTLLCMH